MYWDFTIDIYHFKWRWSIIIIITQTADLKLYYRFVFRMLNYVSMRTNTRWSYHRLRLCKINIALSFRLVLDLFVVLCLGYRLAVVEFYRDCEFRLISSPTSREC
jgi:hypothetical protein